MFDVKRALWMLAIAAIVFTAVFVGNRPASAGGMGGIAVRPARVCLNGVNFAGRATDPNALNRTMVAKIFMGHVGSPFPLVATGNSHVYNAVGQVRWFSIHYPANTFQVGDPVTYSVLANDNSGYGGGQFGYVEKCYIWPFRAF
jgi:hypothetical protein